MENSRRINGTHGYKFLLTNARSLSPKIHSLHTAFIEHDLDFALVTESWLKDGHVLDRDIIDLEWGTDLKIIYKNRPKNAAGLRKVGGGVSIIYNKSRCNLRERKIRGNNFELVLAVGKVGNIPRQVAIFCVYIEPKMKAAELASLCDLISREVLMLKAKGNPLIYLGGDMNKRDLHDALADFNDVVQINYSPTRGTSCLDIVYSNADNLTQSTWPPLETREGVQSDHLCLVFSGQYVKERNFTWVTKTARKHTEQALYQYGLRLRDANWDNILPAHLSSDELVERFQAWTTALTDELFPMMSMRVRSNEDPWVTNGVRRLARKKNRVYKREGKSRLWHQLQARMDHLIEQSKSEYVDNIEKSGSTKQYFAAVKALGTAAKNNEWKLTDLFPGKDDQQAGEEAAAYFTRITDLFPPLQDVDSMPEERRAPVTETCVAKKLKDAKKPNSTVAGDLLPRVVRAHHAWLVRPVTRIFNAIFESGRWPLTWKTETTVIIPKVPTPDTLADCRNISCTPFLSKVLESILLEDLRSEIPPDEAQYGGIKASSVDHLLVDLMDKVLEPLETGRPSLVIGIDFEKAFNRLDHAHCLSELGRLGASKPSLALTRSFLTGRSMRVRVGNKLSTSKPLSGGSPQGSILGCYLYCTATQHLNLSIPRQVPLQDAPQALAPPDQVQERGPQPRTDLNVSASSQSFGLLDGLVTDSSSSSDSFFSAVGSPARSEDDVMPADLQELLLALFKYVDDTTITEAVPIEAVIRHINSNTPTERVLPAGLPPLMAALVEAAKAVGMKINCKKTQMMCYSPDNGYETSASFVVDGEEIRTQENVKLLGYMLGTTPGASAQVEMIRKKFRARFWSLIHLRRAGIFGMRLFKLYAALVRPVLETNCIIFHPMLTNGQRTELERLQKQVVRLCFGYNVHYAEACEMHELETLETRRNKRMRKFVTKALRNDRFASRWFQRRPEIDPELRNRRPFIEKKARTERYRRSPLLHIQRVANDLMTNNMLHAND